MFRRRSWIIVLFLALFAGCQRREQAPRVAEALAPPRELAGLHNVLLVSDGLLSGSVPEGETGFRSLHQMGVRTIISVDGTKPDVALARREGIRYVHLPIGYDGVPREQALRIARAVRDLPGPVYIHCHHGKHRGPAAAAAAALCLYERLSAVEAIAFLSRAGTDSHYTGLYESVRNMRRPTADELANVPADFPETANVPALAELMVGIDERWDRLKAVRAAGWRTPPGHADLDAPHEALQLAEQFREALRLTDTAARANEFKSRLGEADTAAAELQTVLRTQPTVSANAEKLFNRLSETCKKCHEQFRDPPAVTGRK
ncbi:MAG: hypothetical protein ACJ8F7_18370 [Gemmataceae bacterium]